MVDAVVEMKSIEGNDAARKLLLEVKEEADLVLKARGLGVSRLIEMCCCDRRNMGTKLSVGGWCRALGRQRADTIALRLREPKTHRFHSKESLLDTMWHEIAHISYGNHSAQFYALMDEIRRHYELIIARGRRLVDIDGFPISGGRILGGHAARNAREGSLRAANKRRKWNSDRGVHTLGGQRKTLPPKEAAARAAQLRADDLRRGLGDDELRPHEIDDDDTWCVWCGPECYGKSYHVLGEKVAPPIKKDSTKKKAEPPLVLDLTAIDDDESVEKTKAIAVKEKLPRPKCTRPRLQTAVVDLTSLDDDDNALAHYWSCVDCTFNNSYSVDNCQACFLPRERGRSRQKRKPLSPRREEPPPFDPCKSSLNGLQDFRRSSRRLR